MRDGMQRETSSGNMSHTGSYYTGHDDISLVDLARMVVKRKVAFLVVALMVFCIAVMLAFLMPTKYAYVSLYNVAQQAPSENNPSGNLESPAAVASKLRNAFVSQTARDVLAPAERLAFDVEISALDDAGMVMLTSEAKEELETLVVDIHQGALDKALIAQQQRVERRRQALQAQIEQARASLEEMQAASDVDSDFAYQQASLLAELESKLSFLEEGQVSQVGQKSLEPTSVGRAIMILLGVIVGAIAGLLGAFFVEFVATVRHSMKTQKGDA